MAKFYDFNQNNSGGTFVLDKSAGLTVHVIVEANDYEHANRRAEDIGIYFDGVEDGNDCPCCGDRWYRMYDEDGGELEPTVYGEPAAEWVARPPKGLMGVRWVEQGSEVCIHYMDGRKEWL